MTQREARGGGTCTLRRLVRIAVAAAILGMLTASLAGCGRSGAAARTPSGCDGPPSTRACRVLFIGNSYTYVNELPLLFERLAQAGGHGIETAALAAPNATLADHVRWPETTTTLRARAWDIVVLQEQSLIPADPRARRTEMAPASRVLARLARAAGARPALFVTWGHLRGWPQGGIVGYPAMQTAVDAGYEEVARELHALQIPVGPAWAMAHLRHPRLALWQEDGSHPSLAGSYLAACVFYTTIFGQSATGLAYYAGLSPQLALILQSTASEVALPYHAQTSSDSASQRALPRG